MPTDEDASITNKPVSEQPGSDTEKADGRSTGPKPSWFDRNPETARATVKALAALAIGGMLVDHEAQAHGNRSSHLHLLFTFNPDDYVLKPQAVDYVESINASQPPPSVFSTIGGASFTVTPSLDVPELPPLPGGDLRVTLPNSGDGVLWTSPFPTESGLFDIQLIVESDAFNGRPVPQAEIAFTYFRRFGLDGTPTDPMLSVIMRVNELGETEILHDVLTSPDDPDHIDFVFDPLPDIGELALSITANASRPDGGPAVPVDFAIAGVAITGNGLDEFRVREITGQRQVPEPGTGLLVLLILGGLVIAVKRARKAAKS